MATICQIPTENTTATEAQATGVEEQGSMLTISVKEKRLEEGLCPQCSTQLYEIKNPGKKPFFLRGKKEPAVIRKPLTVPGRVMRGQCLVCYPQQALQSSLDSDSADLAHAMATLVTQDDNSSSTNEEDSSADSELAAAITLFDIQDDDEDNTKISASSTTKPTAEEVSNNKNDDVNDAPSLAVATDAEEIPVIALQAVHDGTTYEGKYNLYGQRHDESGTQRWANGNVYQGGFSNGQREGQGTLTFGNDNGEYVGGWRLNEMHGYGTRRYGNGDVYTGPFSQGERHGPEGRFYFANGDLYKGAWEHNHIHGFGRYYYSNGQQFEGFFQNGNRHGKGQYHWTDGQVEIFRYENGVRKGAGIRLSANRKRAWLVEDGKKKGRICLAKAAEISSQL